MSPGLLNDEYSPLDWDIQSQQEGNVMAWLDDYKDIDTYYSMNPEMPDIMDSEARCSIPYEPDSVEAKDYKEDSFNEESSKSSDPQEMPNAEAEEDLQSHESNAPEYTDMAKNPKNPNNEEEEYNWPSTGMTGPTAEEYWNPEVTGLEDNDPSSTLHDQMTSEEVYEWL